MKNIKKVILLILIMSGISQAQFYDSFDKDEIDGWFFLTGDGSITMDFVQKEGFARIYIDATDDNYNVWWAVTKRDVASYLDLKKLKNPEYELRVEARIRVGNAPRRVNMMVNTQRTTNFHKDLMEFDIPDTSNWHVISMTTKEFDAMPGDSVFVQLNVIDWGIGKYKVDVDYYRADIINIITSGSDKGVLVPYHPPVPEVNTYSIHMNASHDALINSDFPDVNFNNWQIMTNKGKESVLTINVNQWAILRWDFAAHKNANIKGAGLLELTTHSVARGGKYDDTFGRDLGMEFGKIRIIEILAGDPLWDQEKVTFNNLIQGQKMADVFNSQMIFDVELSDESGSKNFITISNPVLKRLIDGKTKGLIIRPLGAINASVFSSEDQDGKNSPKLHFNIK